MCQDRWGNLWVGSWLTGFNRLNVESGTVERYPASQGKYPPGGQQTVNVIKESRDGTIRIGTMGAGLISYFPGKNEFTYFSVSDGLAGGILWGILEDSRGYLWISTNNGLSRLDPVSGECRNFNVLDGLQGDNFTSGGYCRGADGIMYFGGLNGMNAFYPRHVTFNRHVPPVVITQFKLFNQSVEVDKDSPLQRLISQTNRLELSHHENSISFEFAALDFTFPNRNRYTYTLEGFDRGWFETGAGKRDAVYTNLDPGKYVFRVKGANNDGVWNDEGVSLNILIHPPYWRTLWFQSAAALFTLALLYLLYRFRVKNVRMKTELETAQHAQMSIMPQEGFTGEGFDIAGICKPAYSVGGDFFDYIRFDRDTVKFGIVVGDVSGKAMDSAMTAVMAGGMVHSKAVEALETDDVLTRVNRLLYLKTRKKDFVALCLAFFHTQEGELVFSNAGLNPPLLKRGKEVSKLKSEGSRLPLGVMAGTVYSASRLRLAPGDLLVFSTDGLTEARPTTASNGDYGSQRLEQLLRKLDTSALSAKDTVSKIIADVLKYSGQGVQHDDITVVVVKLPGGREL